MSGPFCSHGWVNGDCPYCQVDTLKLQIEELKLKMLDEISAKTTARAERDNLNRLYSEVLDLLESHGRFQCCVWQDGRVGCGTCAPCKLNAIRNKTEKR